MHYELNVNGVNVNPANGPAHLVDPQKLIKADDRMYYAEPLPAVNVYSNMPDKNPIMLLDNDSYIKKLINLELK